MPRVMVTTDTHNSEPPRTLLDEFVDPVHLETEHSADAFVERLGWAIVEAEAESAAHGGQVATTGRRQ
jgi:hypothetical protein